jgi:hypothetical protein
MLSALRCCYIIYSMMFVMILHVTYKLRDKHYSVQFNFFIMKKLFSKLTIQKKLSLNHNIFSYSNYSSSSLIRKVLNI